jgi:glycosyltransferase involved in cell wall biosynthesis
MSNLNEESILDIENKAQQIINENVDNKQAKDDRPSIMFCCPGSVLDITSGAAISLLTILEGFAKKGFRAIALQATVFDSGHGGEHIMKAGHDQQKDKPIWRSELNGVEHLIVKTSHFRRHLMTVQQEEIYVTLFRNEVKFRKPDFILLWGGLILERTLMREAKDANIPIVFYLVNPGYKDPSVFKDVDVIITDTESTAKLYKERHNFDCQVVGKFIHKDRVVPPIPRKPEFITLINPSFEKGISFFMPLAMLAGKKYPKIKFLVCQSRGRWNEALKRFNLKATDFKNVVIIGHQHDMRRVYEVTRALLLPSLWHESGARVIAEAQLNGIPVLASDTGGSGELIEDGGKVIPISQEIREKKIEILAKEVDLEPWLDEIHKIWTDADHYQSLSALATLSSKKFEIDSSIERMIKALRPSVIKSKGGQVDWPVYPQKVKNASTSNSSKIVKKTEEKKKKKQILH